MKIKLSKNNDHDGVLLCVKCAIIIIIIILLWIVRLQKCEDEQTCV